MEVYIDGACKNNGKSSAKASYGIFWEQNSTLNINGLVPESFKQTNNTGKLLAAVKCLQQLHENNITDISIKSDSEYLIRGITNDISYWKNNNWKLKSSGKEVKNKEIWSEIDSLSNGINISWLHIPRDSEPGQIESDKLAKLALNLKSTCTASNSTNSQQATLSANVDIEWSDDESETIPMKIDSPRPRSSYVNTCTKKPVNKTNSPSFGVMSALRRIESLLLSTAEDVSNLNDSLNCHIDTTQIKFNKIQDKFVSLSNSFKVQNSSTITAVDEVCTQTQIIKSDMDKNNKVFVEKSKSLWDKMNTVFQEVKSIKGLTKETLEFNKESVPSSTSARNEYIQSTSARNEYIQSTSVKANTPGTYSNAVKLGFQGQNSSNEQTPKIYHNNRQRSDFSKLRPLNLMDKNAVASNNRHSERKPFNFPSFNVNRSDVRKNLFLIGSSTLKRMSARKMSTNDVNTKVKTIRGGRIRDIEECLIQYISEGRLNSVDVIAIHVGTNNVSDGDSVHAIIDDYRNLIYTVKQGLPNTKVIISSILPRPNNFKANQSIADVNRQLWSLKKTMYQS